MTTDRKIVRRSDLNRYVRLLGDRMGLRDWVFVQVPEPPDPNDDGSTNAATSETLFGQRRVKLRWAADWATWTPEYLRSTVVHELLHAHLNRLEDVFDAIAGNLSADLAGTTQHYFRRDLEDAIDAIAVSWATSLPLPLKSVVADVDPQGTNVYSEKDPTA